MEKNQDSKKTVSFSVSVREEIEKSLASKNEFKIQAAAAGITYSSDPDSVLLGDPTDPDFRRYFLRGVFLQCGYCSDPFKTYRIEFRIKNPPAFEIVTEILESEGLPFTSAIRNDLYVIYVRNGDAVSDLLGMMGAGNSRLRFESIRTEREVIGSVNRTMNCDSGNTRRQAEAGAARNELILKLMDSPAFADLPDDLKMTAKVHTANPGASIEELGKLVSPPLGKSGMYNRLKRLLEIAKAID